jgi:eukaryotic-like serine/threonine-protein kinase
VEIVGALLSWLHWALAPSSCPGGWVWTPAVLGVVLGCLAWLGQAVVTLVAARTGRPSAAGFGAVGALLGGVLPLLVVAAAGTVFARADHARAAGLTRADLRSLAEPLCGSTLSQADYLGNGPNVLAGVVRNDGGWSVHGLYLLLVVALPAVAVLLGAWQGRVATRGPARLAFWVPTLVFALATVQMAANVVAQMWLGFAPAALVGVAVLAAVRRVAPRPRPASPAGPPLAATPGPLPLPMRTPTATAMPTPPPIPADLVPAGAPGERFHRIRQLGQGGFGTVWLARDTQLARTVALKLAHAPDVDTERRMLREARALAAVHHPNSVRVFDVIQNAEGLCIVMQYIEGRSLGDAVRSNGPLGDVAAARLWATLAGALLAAHEKGVLHRDVKPSNVLLDLGSTAHLIDYGIARTSGDSTLTASGMVIGTPDYLAPETAKSGTATTDSDAWQLAATVSYALTGQPPRGGRDNAMAALAAAAAGEPCTMVPEHSAHHALLSAALHQDPSRRPTLANVRRTLHEWLGDSGYTATGPVTTTIDAPTLPYT